MKNEILNPLENLHIPAGFLTLRKLQMLIMKISTQVDNHKYRKGVTTKKITL